MSLLPGAIAELFAQVSVTGVLTLADRYGLLAAILEDSLTEDERRAINRVLRAVCRGDVHVVDELSVVL
ncbi:MAG: hypothetical protein Fur0046_35440 [Cyanobacteria bacterium J069]